jgi:hypothetical protein
MEDHAESVLVPAANLFTVGTRRDGEKWPKRDLRKDPDVLDLIHFAVFSPYTAQSMIVARDLLARLDETAPDDADFVDYGTLRLTRARLDKGRALYALGLQAYWCGRIVARLERHFARGGKAVLREFADADLRGVGRWLDWCGMLVPAGEARKLLTAVAAEKFADLKALEAALRDLYEQYDAWEWGWIADVFAKELGKCPEQITVADLKNAVNDWRKTATEALALILSDLEKEFNASVRIGFGLDGDRQAAEADFDAVRGSFDDNKYVKGLRKECEEIKTRTAALLKLLESAT